MAEPLLDSSGAGRADRSFTGERGKWATRPARGPGYANLSGFLKALSRPGFPFGPCWGWDRPQLATTSLTRGIDTPPGIDARELLPKLRMDGPLIQPGAGERHHPIGTSGW